MGFRPSARISRSVTLVTVFASTLYIPFLADPSPTQRQQIMVAADWLSVVKNVHFEPMTEDLLKAADGRMIAMSRKQKFDFGL